MSRRVLVLAFVLSAFCGGLIVGCGGDDAPAVPQTIVLFTGDTWRFDHVSAYAPPDADAPVPRTTQVDRLAATGLAFTDARTPVPLTLPAHTTMLAGLPPAATGVRLNTYGHLPARAARGFPLLPEVLRDAGWRTAAFVSCAVLGKRYGLDQAFDHYDDGDLDDTSQATVAERAGAETVALALAWLRAQPRDARVFVWVHIFEPHAPYVANGTYAGDIAAADAVVGTFLSGLDATRGSDAAVLFTSDHGEALGELKEPTHGFLLADGVLRVPFLLRVPGRGPAQRADPADLADVAPTLAGLAGVAWPQHTGPGTGRDLLAAPAPADRIRFAESLYGHQVHRFAQLSAAHGPTGSLVDAGRDRLAWLPRLGWRRILESIALPPDTPEVRALGKALAEYRQSENSARMGTGNDSAGGYGGGGPVAPFLSPEENARLLDPHVGILQHQALDAVKLPILASRRLPPERRRQALEAALERLAALDRPHLLAGSPERAFWEGEARNEWALTTEGAGGAFTRAAAAYLRAFELGRKDTETLVRACGADAMSHEAAMLERLELLAREVPAPGCRYWLLRARLTGRLEELRLLPAGSHAAACAQAEAHCESRREREIWLGTCR
ncbi:MAG: sulfatase [Planctomycetota bacterium]|nr:sulfatase [Planctomycetota bacterium]